jgi:hypothetical protein
MSATVFWKPVSKQERSFDVPAPSSFAGVMVQRFGGEPWEVGLGDIEWLRGLRDGGNKVADWDEIIAAIEKHGAIRVWREH